MKTSTDIGPVSIPPSWLPTRRKALAIVVWYAIAGTLWLIGSDWLLGQFIQNPALLDKLDVIGDFVYVVVTAAMLAGLLERYYREIKVSGRQLQDYAERLRLVSDNLPDSYIYQYVVTADGRRGFTYLSAGVERLHGVKAAAVLQDAGVLVRLVLPESLPALAAAEEACAKDLSDFELELWMTRPNGERQLFHLRSRPRRIAGGAIQWDGVATDITCRKRAELALQKNEQLLKVMERSSKTGGWDLDPATGEGNWTEEVARIHDLDPSIPPNQAMRLNFYVAESAVRIEAAVKAAVEHGTPYDLDLEIISAKGAHKWVRTICQPVMENGKVIKLTGSFQDITATKIAEESVRSSAQNFREIFNATNEGIVLHDAVTGQVLEVNDTMLRISGYDTKEEFLQGRLEQIMNPESEYNWNEALRRIHLAVAEGPQVFEWQNIKRSGERLWVEVSLSSSKIGGEGRVLAVVRDITQRKLQELEIQRLTRLYATLSQVNQAIVRCQSRQELFTEICRVMIEFGKFRAVWIGEPAGETGRMVTLAHLAAEEFSQPTLPGWVGGCGVIAEAVQNARPALCNQAGTDSRAECCRTVLTSAGVQACAAFPLFLENRVFGAFAICTGEKNFFKPEENRLLEEIAVDVSYALDRLQEQERRRQAELALQQSKTSLHNFLNTAATGLVRNSRDLRYQSVNATYARIVGRPVDQIVGRSLAEVLGERAVVKLHPYIDRVLAGERVEFETELPFTTTGPQWIHVVYAPDRDAAGAIIGWVASVTDITERKRAEVALRESESRNWALVETTFDWIWEVDANGRYTYASKKVGEFLGYTPDEVMGRTPYDLMPETEGQRFRAMVETFTIEAKPFAGLETTIRHKDGRLIVLETSGVPIFGPAHQFQGYRGVNRDITGRKRLEEARERQQSRVALLGNISRQLVMSDSPAGLLNDIFTKLAGELDVDIFANYMVAPRGNQLVLESSGGLTEPQRRDFATLPFGISLCGVVAQTRQSQVFANLPEVPEPQAHGIIALGVRAYAGHPLIANNRLIGTISFGSRRRDRYEDDDVRLMKAVADQVAAAVERFRLLAVVRASEERFRAYVDQAADAIFVHDFEGRFVAVNRQACVSLGYQHDELLGLAVMDVSVDFDLASAQKKWSALRPGEPFTIHDHHRRKNGTAFPAEIRFGCFDKDGERLFLGVARDVTEREQAEAALRQSEEQFRTMFEVASIGMVQSNPLTRQFVRVNRKFCEITGYAEQELLQMKVNELTHPDDVAAEEDLFRRVVLGETPSYRIEKRYVRKDRSIAWVNVNMAPVRDVSGQPLRTMTTVEDITDRKAAEETLRLQGAALGAAANAILITDRTGRIEWVNQAFTTITGFTAADVLGRHPRLFKSGQHDLAFYEHLWETILAGNTWHGELVNRRKDGSLYNEDMTITPVRDAQGNVAHFIGIKQDVTERKRLETQARQSQKMEAIGTLAGGVAHDFNNILTSILMQVELATMDAGLAQELGEGLEQIRSDAERAASLTRQLLLFSRRQVMQSRVLDLNELVTNFSKMLRRIIGEDVKLQLNLDAARLMIQADPGMMDQVVMNLAVNARDAMPEGGQLAIATSAETVDEAGARLQMGARPGAFVVVSVSDTGCGIAPEVLPRIFEPFFTTKEPGKGTGLGLATVFGIVNQHHGWVAVDSTPGKGTNFKVYLPASTAMQEASGAGAAVARPRGGGETILLVEDEPAVRKSTNTVLLRHGYAVLEAEGGAEAQRIWETGRDQISLLLTDLVMPGGMTGHQLARKLQGDKPGLKVIYCSGYSAEIAGKEIELRAGENFVQKPVAPEALLKIVRDCLDH